MLNASSTRASRISAAGVFQNGPPDAVRITLAMRSTGSPRRHWKIALCSLSTGSKRPPLARACEKSSSPAATISFFVGNRNVDARINPRQNTASNATATVSGRKEDIGVRIDRNRAKSRCAVGLR